MNPLTGKTDGSFAGSDGILARVVRRARSRGIGFDAAAINLGAERRRALIRVLLRSSPTVIRIAPTLVREAARPVRSLTIQSSDAEAVVVSIDDDMATLSGAPMSFKRLARELELFAEYNDLSEPGMHAHFDPNDEGQLGGTVLGGDSCPLIVSGPVPGDAH